MNFNSTPAARNLYADNPFWPSPVLQRRWALGIALSVGVHFLGGLSTAYGWLNLMPWFGKPEEKPVIVLRAQLAAPPAPLPASAATSPAVPAPSRPKPAAIPRKPAAPGTTSPVIAQAPAAAAPPAQPPAPLAADSAASTKSEAPAAREEPALPLPPAPPPAPTPKAAKASPFPERARIEFEMTLESNNFKVWATQTWEGRDGKYRVFLSAEAKALFFSIGKLTMESAGVITADGLRPERYVDERNQRRTTVTYAANEKSAFVEEPNGNKKTVQLAGQAADVMSLTYDLGFNADLPVGTRFTLSNRDTVEEIILTEKRDEMLVTDTQTLATRFFDLKRPNGSGGVQVWLATEKQWLPAKLRILGRDGAVTLTAIKFEVNPVTQ